MIQYKQENKTSKYLITVAMSHIRRPIKSNQIMEKAMKAIMNGWYGCSLEALPNFKCVEKGNIESLRIISNKDGLNNGSSTLFLDALKPQQMDSHWGYDTCAPINFEVVFFP